MHLKKFFNKGGFTLIELVIVIAIISILSSIFIPNYMGYIDKANKVKIVCEGKQLFSAAIESYKESGNVFDNYQIMSTVEEITGINLKVTDINISSPNIVVINYISCNKINRIQIDAVDCSFTISDTNDLVIFQGNTSNDL
jgi:type IV pilus assembly protein PilA